MSYFVTYFAHPKAPYLTVTEEGQSESVTVFVRKDEDGKLSVDGLPPIEEGVNGWETLKVASNGVEYIHNKTPFEANFEGLNPSTSIATRVVLRRAEYKAVHLSIKRRASPAETL